MELTVMEELPKRFGPVLAVSDLSFSVPGGRVIGAALGALVKNQRRPWPRMAVGTVTLLLLLAGCGTGVADEKGWNKALKRGYPCTELLDIAKDLPSSVDPQKVAQDLRRVGCEPLLRPSGREKGEALIRAEERTKVTNVGQLVQKGPDERPELL